MAMGGRHAQQQGQMRADGTHRKLDHAADQFQIKLSSVALIGGGGIVEAVTQDDLAGGQRGLNHLTHQLGAAGVHEEQLRLRHHQVVRLAVLEQVADLFSDGSAARLTEGSRTMAQLAEPVGQQCHLRALAPTLSALEADE